MGRKLRFRACSLRRKLIIPIPSEVPKVSKVLERVCTRSREITWLEHRATSIFRKRFRPKHPIYHCASPVEFFKKYSRSKGTSRSTVNVSRSRNYLDELAGTKDKLNWSSWIIKSFYILHSRSARDCPSRNCNTIAARRDFIRVVRMNFERREIFSRSKCFSVTGVTDEIWWCYRRTSCNVTRQVYSCLRIYVSRIRDKFDIISAISPEWTRELFRSRSREIVWRIVKSGNSFMELNNF